MHHTKQYMYLVTLPHTVKTYNCIRFYVHMGTSILYQVYSKTFHNAVSYFYIYNDGMKRNPTIPVKDKVEGTGQIWRTEIQRAIYIQGATQKF